VTDDLAAFLRARLGEDEAVAKDEHERIWFGPYPETIAEREGWLVIQQERALREVVAKRAILVAHWPDEYGCQVCQGETSCPLEYLAAVYCDHPDYRQEWAP
jgi:hypothetical protein